MASNLTGTTYTTTDGVSNDCGFTFTANSSTVISAIVKDASCSATTVNVYNSSFALQGTATFSGNTATFVSPLAISSGATYYATITATTRAIGTSVAFPRVRTGITYTEDAYMVTPGVPSSIVTGLGQDYNITDIQTGVTVVQNSNFLMHT